MLPHSMIPQPCHNWVSCWEVCTYRHAHKHSMLTQQCHEAPSVQQTSGWWSISRWLASGTLKHFSLSCGAMSLKGHTSVCIAVAFALKTTHIHTLWLSWWTGEQLCRNWDTMVPLKRQNFPFYIICFWSKIQQSRHTIKMDQCLKPKVNRTVRT